MKKRGTKNLLLFSLISIFLLIFNFIIKKQIFIFAESIMAAFMIVVVFLSFILFGYQKDKNTRIKSGLFFQIGQVLVGYFIVIYLLGIYFGFSKIVFSLKPASILNNIFAPIITFVFLEIFRYIIINNNRDKVRNIYLYSILIGLLELSVTTKYLPFGSFEAAYKTIADFIIPIVIKQFAFGYLGYYGGLKPLMLYRVVIVLYTYVVPIHPNFGPALVCMSNILLPLFILMKTNEVIDEENKEKEKITKNNNTFWYIGSTVVIVVLFLFVTGVLPIGMTAIASDSMHPAFDKGSAVITLKVKQEELKKGDIISFYKDNKVIIHRIDSIVEEEGEIRYITKGDANNVADDGYILYDQIKNKIVLSIPLIGYPSLIVGEVFNR